MLKPYSIVYQHSDLTTGTWHRFHYTLPEAESSARYLLKRDLPGTRLLFVTPADPQAIDHCISMPGIPRTSLLDA